MTAHDAFVELQMLQILLHPALPPEGCESRSDVSSLHLIQLNAADMPRALLGALGVFGAPALGVDVLATMRPSSSLLPSLLNAMLCLALPILDRPAFFLTEPGDDFVGVGVAVAPLINIA